MNAKLASGDVEIIKMLPQQYCLKWKHHHTNVQSMFSQLLEKERFCDVTLYCSPSFARADAERGVSLRAHRVVLAACSELLSALLFSHDTDARAEPVLVIDGAEPGHVRALLRYMYTGEMNVQRSQLASLLKTAEELRIKGLSDIRWSGKDDPPDCQSGAVTATPAPMERVRQGSFTASTPEPTTPTDKYNLNGGPPPLIKLPAKGDKQSPAKRDTSADVGDAPTPKRNRMTSKSENTDEDDIELEWNMKHENMDASGSVCGSGRDRDASRGSWDSGSEDDEWHRPGDISRFLHTNLRVDGDNSDEDQSDRLELNTEIDIKPEVTLKPLSQLMPATTSVPAKASNTSLSGAGIPILGSMGGARAPSNSDPRFADVVKLNEYLLHGRRPHFWEEDYVRRVMEMVRMKELEMKQAAEILGVSYGTLYGRYRDVYGCINRPYRMKDFWTEQGPTEVLHRLQRGECTLGAAAEALGVPPTHLATYLATMHTRSVPPDRDFEPIPIEGEPVADKKKTQPSGSVPAPNPVRDMRKNVAAAEKAVKKILIGSLSSDNEDSAPSNSSKQEAKPYKAPSLTKSNSGASSRSDSGSTSPSSLMRCRPDLTIVASNNDS